MDLFFNELSVDERNSINQESISILVEIYRELQNYGITTCRIDSEDSFRLLQMIQDMPNFMNVKNFYFSFFRAPYESETVERQQDIYLEHDWTYNSKACIGLALASVLDSAGLSIYEEKWNIAFVELKRDEDEVRVRNICKKEHVDQHIPQLQLDEEPELIECTLKFEEKRISLRKDHGQDVLMDFSRRLIRCPYVVGIVNSLPFSPNNRRRFIKRVHNDGLIEIVLPWTDEGYGVVVKTTGRNIRETERIGQIIYEEYGGI